VFANRCNLVGPVISALAAQCGALKHKFFYYDLKQSDPIVIIFGTTIYDIVLTGHHSLTQLLLLH